MTGTRMRSDLFLIAAATLAQAGSTIRFNCYSCMTTEFQRLLNEKQTFYYKQRTFDDKCAKKEIQATDGIQTIPCTTVCLHLWDYRVEHSFGTSMPAKHIRGCLDSIFDPRYYRANDSYAYALTQLHRKTCPVIQVENLIATSGKYLSVNYQTQYRSRHPDRQRNTGSVVNSCLCYGNLCNAVDSGGRRRDLEVIFLLLNTFVLFCFVWA